MVFLILTALCIAVVGILLKLQDVRYTVSGVPLAVIVWSFLLLVAAGSGAWWVMRNLWRAASWITDRI